MQPQRIYEELNDTVKFIDLDFCRHNRCLIARSEPLVTCAKCNCLVIFYI